MTYKLYDTILREDENVYLDYILNLEFPEDDEYYIFINVKEDQTLMDISISLYNNVNHWKMLSILNNIENPMKQINKKIKALKPEYIQEIENGS